MSDQKFPLKRYNLVTKNIKKREQFLQPLIEDEQGKQESNDQSYFSIVKNRKNQEKKTHEERGYYVSPMRGRIPNKATFPIHSSRGKIDKQYDFIRQKTNQKGQEFRNNFGEFKLFNREPQFTPQQESHPVEEQAPTAETNFVFTEHLSFEPNLQKEAKSEKEKDFFEEKVDLRSSIDENKRPHVPQQHTVFHVLYEEEIELSDDRSVVTSYDESQNYFYFGDYDKYYKNKPMGSKVQPSAKQVVQVNEYSSKERQVLDEIKEIFSDVHEDFNGTATPRKRSTVFFEEDYEFGDQKNSTPTRISDPINTTEPLYQKPMWNDEEDEEEVTVRSFPKREEAKFKDLKRELDLALKEQLDDDDEEEEIVKSHSSVNKRVEEDYTDYEFPSLDLLKQPTEFQNDQTAWAEEQLARLDQTLESFGIAAHTVNYTIGPSVTRFEIEPDPGTKVSRITSLADDIQLRLAAKDIFIEAPIAGKSTVGIEVPNPETRMVNIREILESNSYRMVKSPLKIALGLDITGAPIFSDISAMTHSLIAGSTGSGKSVCINGLIISIIYNALPSEVKMVLIDPKKVEFAMYRDIPHLLTPVINDPKEATATLKWLTEEMDRRYELIESVGARDIKSYNFKRSRSVDELPKLPYIVVIIDELADLMMVAMNEVEEYIQRIAQLARAAGIHLIVATQRPSANVITGTIKTNIPTRISFKVASSIDSRIILDSTGAERLIGKGDMLFIENGKSAMKRLQGSFISDDEIERVTDFCRDQATPNYQFYSEDLLKTDSNVVVDYEDDLFDDAVRFVIELGEASASRIQRQFKVGYNRAARMIDMMEQQGIIAPHSGGSKPREVLVSPNEYSMKNRRY